LRPQAKRRAPRRTSNVRQRTDARRRV
jgi:hypothetical protein